MGHGIVQTAAEAGFNVVGVDAFPDAADKAMARIKGSLSLNAARAVKKGGVSEEDATAAADAAFARISTAAGVDALAGCDLVIEAMPESVELKRRVWSDVRAAVPSPSAVFATNTSSIQLADMAAAADAPGRFVGLHFFNPVQVMRLVEVVRLDDSDPAVVDTCVRFVRALRKEPVLCKDTPGFVVNRLLVPYMAQVSRATPPPGAAAKRAGFVRAAAAAAAAAPPRARKARRRQQTAQPRLPRPAAPVRRGWRFWTAARPTCPASTRPCAWARGTPWGRSRSRTTWGSTPACPSWRGGRKSSPTNRRLSSPTSSASWSRRATTAARPGRASTRGTGTSPRASRSGPRERSREGDKAKKKCPQVTTASATRPAAASAPVRPRGARLPTYRRHTARPGAPAAPVAPKQAAAAERKASSVLGTCRSEPLEPRVGAQAAPSPGCGHSSRPRAGLASR